MKSQPVYSNSGTIEDIVFESRNKAYGAYDLNQKRRKYLVIAFFISLLGVSSAIAVPMIKAFKNEGVPISLPTGGKIIITGIEDEIDLPVVPPPPQSDEIEQIGYTAPLVVEDAPVEVGGLIVEDLLKTVVNAPVDSLPLVIEKPTEPTGIDEKPETVVLFPQERATFLGGTEEDFRIWLIKNMVYPEKAAELKIFGKVIVQFCVNSKGKIVDIQFVRSLDPLVDNEVLRVLSSSPEWTPAKQGGIPVKTSFTIPVLFQMQ